MVTFSAGMPRKAAKAACAMPIAWFGVSMVSRSPSQAATMAWGSMALWYWSGVSTATSVIRAAAARPASRSPTARVGGAPMPTASRLEGDAVVEADARRLGLVGRREQACAFGRGLEGLGDDEGDRLAGVADAVVLQRLDAPAEDRGLGVGVLGERRAVRRGHHRDDAGMGLGGGDVERGDAAAGDRAGGIDGVEQALGVVVGGVGGGAGHLEDAVAAGHRLAAVGAEADVAGGRGAVSGMGRAPVPGRGSARTEPGRAGIRAGVPAAAAASARTTSRRASSIF